MKTGRLFCALLFFLLSVQGILAEADEGFIGTSPDGSVTIRRRHINGSQDAQYVDFENAKSHEVLFSFRSKWRNTTAVWENPGNLVCINDQTETSGDAVYIFRIGPGTRITLLRYPNDEDFSSDLSNRLSKLPDSGRFTFTGVKWLPNHQLLTLVSAGLYGESKFDATLQINEDGGIDLIKPKVKPYVHP